jgi:hypothetical protein
MHINFDVLLTSAMGFSLAIIWNETFIKVINSCFPKRTESQVAVEYLIYAFVITIIIIICAVVINKLNVVGGRLLGGKSIISN